MLTFVFNAGTVAKDCGGFGTSCMASYSTITQFHNGEKLYFHVSFNVKKKNTLLKQ